MKGEENGDLVPVFTNFNEDGQEYDKYDNLEDAMVVLREFPNDSIMVTLEQAKPVRCVCGYHASDSSDLDQHVLASMHLPGDHAESR